VASKASLGVGAAVGAGVGLWNQRYPTPIPNENIINNMSIKGDDDLRGASMSSPSALKIPESFRLE
jgi:hypothetical protein